jgi:hypothetical protein
MQSVSTAHLINTQLICSLAEKHDSHTLCVWVALRILIREKIWDQIQKQK